MDRVRYVGEPVAMVITSESYQGEDGAELVSVDYEPLPAVIGIGGALETQTLLFDGTDSNMPVTSGDAADDAIFAGCDAVVERTIVNQRLAPMPMEGRAAAACFEDGKLTYWLSTQTPHQAATGWRGARPRSGGGAGDHPRCWRRVRREDSASRTSSSAGAPAGRPAGALDREPQREHDRDDHGRSQINDSRSAPTATAGQRAAPRDPAGRGAYPGFAGLLPHLTG